MPAVMQLHQRPWWALVGSTGSSTGGGGRRQSGSWVPRAWTGSVSEPAVVAEVGGGTVVGRGRRTAVVVGRGRVGTRGVEVGKRKNANANTGKLVLGGGGCHVPRAPAPLLAGSRVPASSGGAVVPSEKEISRRMKISAANKGKVPWNKGKNMSEEVKARISQRTYEAMQRPDVKERMKKANEHRAPHSEEVRDKIRKVLRERAASARKIIRVQADMIVESMKRSSVVEEQVISESPKAADVIGRLAWRVLHKDFERMHEKWSNNTEGFRDAVIERFRSLEEQDRKRKLKRSMASRGKKAVGSRKVTSSSVNSKVHSAIEAHKKLEQAKEKLASVEEALGKMRKLKDMYKDDPESLSVVIDKESRTVALMGRLREQVGLLHDAMEPLQEYLSPSGMSKNYVRSVSKNELNAVLDDSTDVAPPTPQRKASEPVLAANSQVPWHRRDEM